MNKIFVFLIALFPSLLFSQNGNLLLNQERVKKLTLENNPELKISRAEISLEKGNLLSEWFPEQPTIGIEVEETPEGRTWRAANEKRFFIEQSFDFPTNYIFSYKILSKNIRLKKLEFENHKREVLFQTITAYWKAVLYNQLVDLYEKNLRLAESFFHKAETSYKLGEVDRLYLLKAKVNLSRSQATLFALQKDYETAIKNLLGFIGIENDSISSIQLLDTLSFTKAKINPEILKNSLTNHPHIQAAELNLSIASNSRGLALGKLLPEISLSYFKQEIDKNTFWGGEIGIAIPLWFTKNIGEIQKSNAQINMAEHSFHLTKINLTRELNEAVANLKKAEQKVVQMKQGLLQEAEEIFRVANNSYRVGEIGYLQYIDAQQILIDTRRDYLESLFEYQVEKANLNRLTGIEN